MSKFAADYRLNEDGRVHFLGTGSRFPLKFRTCLVGGRALGDYEKKKAEHNALIEKVAALNAEANTTTTDFNTSDAAGTVKDVKSTVKKLKAAKAANKKLAKSQKTLNKMEKGIVKLQDQIGDLDKKVRFVEQ